MRPHVQDPVSYICTRCGATYEWQVDHPFDGCVVGRDFSGANKVTWTVPETTGDVIERAIERTERR